MSEDYDVFEVKAKPEPKAKAKPKPEVEPEPTEEDETVRRVRGEIWRMWHAEPEETR